MADPAALAMLGSGYVAWNEARDDGRFGPVPDLSGADLRHSRLALADLSAVNLAGANLAGRRVRRLERAVLDGADLTGARLAGAKLQGASMRRARFHGANLRSADLRHADLRGAELVDADLGLANFEDADLTGADLRGALLQGCRLVGARLDDTVVDSNLSSAMLHPRFHFLNALPVGPPLTLRIDVHDAHGPRPTVSFSANGIELIDDGSFVGFSPRLLLGPSSPLWPADPPRRIALYRCCCGMPACGCVAAVIERVGAEIHWSDFRDYTAVYDKPDSDPSPTGGVALAIPTLRFDAAAYDAEVRRASNDQAE